MEGRSILLCLLFFNLLFVSLSWSEEPAKAKSEKDQNKESLKEIAVTTSHSVKIDGKVISYQATVGMEILKDEQGNPKASMFYIAYKKEGDTDRQLRPTTFCFNGGPGSSSVWLHLGIFGPRRVNIQESGLSANQPYHLVENPYSILDLTDLVFIDPVSTGYSRPAPGEDAKQFHGVEEDVQSVAEFIRLYVTRNNLWESPKYIAGESYGTTRAAGLALELHDTHRLFTDGIILISSILNFQTSSFTAGNDLPYILYLPTYTATALYHNRLSKELQSDALKTMAEVENFALKDYACALLLGDRIDPKQYQDVLAKLSSYTGLSKDFLQLSNLRVSVFCFINQLLKEQRRIVGRFDSRMKGMSSEPCDDAAFYDPSLEMVLGLFASTFNNYIRQDLNWKSDEEYKILISVGPWNYGSATNHYLNVSDKLKEVMTKNNALRVYTASGIYDLALPYFSTEYTFSHLALDPALKGNVITKTYEGGHMMYLYQPSLIKMKSDISNFFLTRKQPSQPKSS